MTMANVLSITTQRKLDHEKQVGLADSRPQIASSKSLCLNSLLQAKSNLPHHHGRIRSRLSQLTKVMMAPVIARHPRIHRHPVNLRASTALCQRHSRHLQRCPTSLDMSPLQMAAIFLHLTP